MPIWTIWRGGSGQKVLATMASKISTANSAPDWTGPRISHKDFAAKLAARRAELGLVNPAHLEQVEGRNSGERRTESKKALLKAIEDLGGKW